MIEGPHGARTRKFLKAHSFPLLHTARYMGTCGQIGFDCPIRFLDSLNVACTNQAFDGARGLTLIAVTLPSLPARCTKGCRSDNLYVVRPTCQVCHPHHGCQTYRYAIPTMMLHMTACACSGLRWARARIRPIAISSRRRSSVLCQQRVQHLRPSLSFVMPFCTAPA